MNKPVMLTIALLLAGCSAVPVPMSGETSDWQQYGMQRGESGLIQQSQAKLAKLDQSGQFNPQLYQAYVTGYQLGNRQYCQQDAFMLGIKGMPYMGVCDDIDPMFNYNYMSGRNSTAGRI